MFLILFKRFTSGSIVGIRFEDRLTVKTLSDLDILNNIGKEIKACAGPNYVLENVYIYDKESDNYLTRKQAEWKLKGY
jgi:hypothetical protein